MKKILATVFVGLLGTSVLAGDMIVRMRALTVMPDETGTIKEVAGSKINISAESVPEIDLTYFFTNNIAVEAIFGTATHDVYADLGSDTNGDLGSVTLLPPTITLQYHAEMGNFKPYAGVGVNYTLFIDEVATTYKDINYDSSFGYAMQIGGDYKVTDNMYLNFDIKKVMITTDVTVTTHSDTKLHSEVDIDPLLVGLGIGYRF
jgi:outer membrane protein